MKILLVEDDALLVDIYKTKFQTSGFEVAVLQQGDKVVETAQRDRPDVIILDVVLPNEDGWEVLKRIRKEQNLEGMKVVILSNLGQKEEVEKGFQLGADKYLIKAHYTPSQVVSEIVSLLGDAGAQKQALMS